jgi:hypothetical protein
VGARALSASIRPLNLHPDLERVALLGWRLTPVWANRAGCFKGYIDAATHDLDQIERWQHEYRGCNWSVIPDGSSVWALDVDVPSADHEADGWSAFLAMQERHGALPAAPHGRSGGGGHLFVFKDAGHPIKCESGWPQPGFDPRARRVQFTIAPSLHGRTRRPYTWQVAPWEVAPPVAPQWLLNAVAPPPERARPARPSIPTTDSASRALARAVDTVIGALPGRRNSTLNRAAYIAGGFAGAGVLGERDAVVALYAAGRHIGLADAECRVTIRSGFEAGFKNPVRGDK